MAAAVAALLAVGVSRAGQPRTADQRELTIAKQLACPVCDGESVAESQAASAVQIRGRIKELVDAGQLSDTEIAEVIDAAYQDDLALEPSGSGIDALAWALPAIVAVVAAAGLVAAFGRWRRAAVAGVSDADRDLVARALAGAPTDRSPDTAGRSPDMAGPSPDMAGDRAATHES